MKKFQTTSKTYFVNINEDGTLFISYDGENSIPNPGMFVNNIGGIDAILSRLEEKEYTTDDVKTFLREKAEYQKGARARQIARDAQKREERAKMHKAAFEDLLAASDNGVIETTMHNVAVVLSYLNDGNIGTCVLPKMSIGYSYNQYDCDGKLAGAMKLDRPIEVDGEIVDKFQVGAPIGYLSKYHRCW